MRITKDISELLPGKAAARPVRARPVVVLAVRLMWWLRRLGPKVGAAR